MKRIIVGFCAFLFFSGAVSARTNNEPSVSDRTACESLARARKGQWSVTSADFKVPPFTISTKRGSADKISVVVPFCRIAGTAKPTAESNIQFELWLPPRADWNGKFEGVGSGASRGTIEYQQLIRGIVRGYATVSTDSGHDSKSAFDVSWALGQPQRVIDFGYRGEHTVTQAAKALTARFYRRAPRHSYFIGCSQGGHHGLMEAQRFPQDYDGIIAGDPVYSWTGEMTGQAWNVRAVQRTPAGALPVPKLQFLYEAVAKACAGDDGLIADPRYCSFDPVSLRCTAAEQSSCLTDAEVEAVRKMYDGPKTSAGRQIYPGLSRGGESGWGRLWSNPSQLGGSGVSFYRYVLFQNPAWDLSTMDFDHDPDVARQKLGNVLDPDNPDLSRFSKRGGKIIVYHGWEDDMVPSQVSIDYYDSVTAKLGSKRVNTFYRLFMIPGMWHCSGGPGANVLFHSDAASTVPLDPDRDLLRALEQWVEQGRAPSSFIASRLSKDGTVERTQLVCPYHSVAKYRGEGGATGTENLACFAE